MKAKLIKSLTINGKTHRPAADKPVIVDLDAAVFAKLEAAGKVAKPTPADLLMAGVVEVKPVAEPEATEPEPADKPRRGRPPKAADAKPETDEL